MKLESKKKELVKKFEEKKEQLNQLQTQTRLVTEELIMLRGEFRLLEALISESKKEE